MGKTRARATKARFEKWVKLKGQFSRTDVFQLSEGFEPAATTVSINGCEFLPYGTPSLPTDPKARKDLPMVRGCLDYFPAALAAVAEVSRIGNDQHNPGQPMHHARGKSMDHADCIVRHLMDRGTIDTDGIRHSAKVAWRALALLQEELEATGAPLARGAKLPEEKKPTQAEIDQSCDCGVNKGGQILRRIEEHAATCAVRRKP